MAPFDKQTAGTRSLLRALEGPSVLVERLYEIGFLPGEEFVFLGRAPLGGPWLFQVRGITVALRIEEAQCLAV
ncbi:FeoA domain-containing protein [bacterium]|nr:FeoA domain-containing protein [bacterium]